jgi:hypothetical protein
LAHSEDKAGGALLRRVLIWLVLLGMIAAAVMTRPWDYLPPQWNPWEPLQLQDPMTPVTRWKLSRLGNDPELCVAVLETAPEGSLRYTDLEDYTPVAGCPLTNVVCISRSGVSYSSPFTVTCPLAVAWLMFEDQAMQPLAEEHLGNRVTRIDHFGSFACRNVYHRASGRRSQHATANAFDLAGFRLEGGGNVTVLRDWDNPAQPARSEFLRDLHSAACGYFGTVLGPDYNQPHENHFHFDMSGFGFCR